MKWFFVFYCKSYLKLEPIQTWMTLTQKPILREGIYAHAIHASQNYKQELHRGQED